MSSESIKIFKDLALDEIKTKLGQEITQSLSTPMKISDSGQFWTLGTPSFSIAPASRLIGTIAGLSTMAAIVTLSCPAQAALLTDWTFDVTNNQLEFVLKDDATPKYFLMAQPVRIVVDIPATQLGKVPNKQNFDGPIRQIRLSQSKEGQTRIVLELAPGTVLAAEQVKLQKVGNRWIVRPLIVASGTAPTNGIPPETVSPPYTSPTATPRATTGTAALPPGIPPITPPAQTSGTSIGAASLPPPIFMGNQSPSISVPPLGQPPISSSTNGASLPAAQSVLGPPVVVAPSLPPTVTARPATTTPSRVPVIEFGQPLPKSNLIGQPQTSLPPLEPGGILLPIEAPASVAN